ncbi:MAG: ferritin [Candidatus Lindowbacteria bacterium]|nr:ferritin [Candidatus Lindowbacteria bacterium]
MNVYICRICGDPYVGNTKPSNCPFCGAPAKYIILAENWVESGVPELTEVSRKHLEASLKLEIDNVQFYRCAANLAKEPMSHAMFKALSRIEAEHAAKVCKLLKRPMLDIEDKPNACVGATNEEHLKEALHRELSAVRFYTSAASSATEAPVKEFFEALVEVENDHISLSNLGLGLPAEV